MGWFPESAACAYLETIKLCRLHYERRSSSEGRKAPHSTEFIAALVAGMNAQLIIEISSSVSSSTIALATAARHTGGRLILILSNSEALLDAMTALKDLDLSSVVEFVIGDAKAILPDYSDVDFAVVDCKNEEFAQVFDDLNLNPSCAVVVADNLYDSNATTAYNNYVNKRPGASSITLPFGKGIQVTRFSREESKDDGKVIDYRHLRGARQAGRNGRDGSRRVRFFIEHRHEMTHSIRVGVTGW